MLLKANEDTRKQRQRMSNSLSLFLGVGGFVSLAFRVPIRNYENLFAQEQKQSDKHNKEIQRRVECLFFFFEAFIATKPSSGTGWDNCINHSRGCRETFVALKDEQVDCNCYSPIKVFTSHTSVHVHNSRGRQLKRHP
jgi:hypothetical protein